MKPNLFQTQNLHNSYPQLLTAADSSGLSAYCQKEAYRKETLCPQMKANEKIKNLKLSSANNAKHAKHKKNKSFFRVLCVIRGLCFCFYLRSFASICGQCFLEVGRALPDRIVLICSEKRWAMPTLQQHCKLPTSPLAQSQNINFWRYLAKPA